MTLLLLALSAGCRDTLLADFLEADDVVKVRFSLEGMLDEKGREAVFRGFEDDKGVEMLHTVHFIFFDADGKYVCTKLTTDIGTDTHFSLTNLTEIAEATPYKTLVIGNAPDFVPSGFQNDFARYVESLKGADGGIATYDEMRSKLMLMGNVRANNYPLIGQWVDGTGRERDFIVKNSEANGMVKFTRSVCKLHVVNNVANLHMKRVAVVNVPQFSFLYHSDVAGGLSDQYRYTTPGDLKDEFDYSDWAIMPENENAVYNAFYIFPNAASSPEPHDFLTTCLIIEGDYDDGTTIHRKRFWRMNLTPDGYSQMLQANHEYTVEINSVTDAGHDTPYHAWAGEYLLTCTPNKEEADNGILYIEGFDPRPMRCRLYTPDPQDIPISLLNGITKDPVVIQISLNNPKNFYIDVESSFAVRDAALSQEQYPSALPTDTHLTNVPNNKEVYLHIYRTGPDDTPISGQVKIHARSKRNDKIHDTYIQDIVITTNCKHGDVILKKEKFYESYGAANLTGFDCVLIADRNSEVARYKVSATGEQTFNTLPDYFKMSDFTLSPTSISVTVNQFGCKHKNGGSSYCINPYGVFYPCWCGAKHPYVKDWMKGPAYYNAELDPAWYSPTGAQRWDRFLPNSYEKVSVYNNPTKLTTCLDANVIMTKYRLFIISDYKFDGAYRGCWISQTTSVDMYNGTSSLVGTCPHSSYTLLSDCDWRYPSISFSQYTKCAINTLLHGRVGCIMFDNAKMEFTSNPIYIQYGSSWIRSTHSYIGYNRHWLPLTRAEILAERGKIGSLTDRDTDEPL